MFDDMDEKFELDVIEDEVDYLEDTDKMPKCEKKMNRRKTLIDVSTALYGCIQMLFIFTVK